MSTPDTLKNNINDGAETIKQSDAAPDNEKNIIPPKYQNLPSDVVEELWNSPIYLDKEKNQSEIEHRQKAIEQIKANEISREKEKRNQLTKQYSELPDEDKNKFPDAQNNTVETVNDFIKMGVDLDRTTTEEDFVLTKVRATYDDFKENNPDKEFHFKLSSDIDKQIWDNLNYRLAFDVLNSQKEIENQKKINEIRKEIGIPPKDIEISEPKQQSEEKTSKELGEAELAKESIKSKEYETSGPLDIDNLDSIKTFANKKELESRQSYEDSLDKALEALKKNEGVVEIKNNDVPTIVLSDLHARRDFLVNTLSKKMPDGETVHDLLKQGKINIVCVGDGMHSEKETDWKPDGIPYYLNKYKNEFGDKLKTEIEQYQKTLENLSGKGYDQMTPFDIAVAKRDPQAELEWKKIKAKLTKEVMMEGEMARSFGTMKMVMELKAKFPESFHYTRGNHDDIKENIKGFYKLDNESADVKKWVTDNFGQDFLDKYAEFEESLPLIVKCKDYVISHAAPSEVFTRDQINQKNKEVTTGLTWTDNRKGQTDESIIEQTLKNLGAENSRWIIGHRPVVEGKTYREQFNSKLIQINHAKDQLIAVLPADDSFNPEENIHNIKS